MFINYGSALNHAGKCVVHQPGVSIERKLRTRLGEDSRRTIPAGAVLDTDVLAGMALVGDTTPRGIILVPVILGLPTCRSARSQWRSRCHHGRMIYRSTPTEPRCMVNLEGVPTPRTSQATRG